MHGLHKPEAEVSTSVPCPSIHFRGFTCSTNGTRHVIATRKLPPRYVVIIKSSHILAKNSLKAAALLRLAGDNIHILA